MKKVLLTFLLVIFVTALLGETKPGGGSVQFGYQFTSLDAATELAKQMGLEVENTNELQLDLNGWGVLNRYLRLGGVISAGYFDAKGEPNQEIMEEDESGVGFVDARIGFLPEVHINLGPVNTSAGLVVGGGGILTFVNDDTGDNDNDMYFYGFMRPQVSAGYDFGPIGAKVTLGYHMPITSETGELWFYDSHREKVAQEFETTDFGGVFIEAGIFFGDLGIRD